MNKTFTINYNQDSIFLQRDVHASVSDSWYNDGMKHYLGVFSSVYGQPFERTVSCYHIKTTINKSRWNESTVKYG